MSSGFYCFFFAFNAYMGPFTSGMRMRAIAELRVRVKARFRVGLGLGLGLNQG